MHTTSISRLQSLLGACFVGVISLLVMGSGVVDGQDNKGLSNAEIERQQQEDLMVFSQVLKSFQVKDMPASKTLEQVWIQAVGRPPNIFLPQWSSQDETAKEPMISLNLRDVPVKDVLLYISDLSSSRLVMQGIDGVGIRLSLVGLTSFDDTERLVSVSTAELTDAGATLLGLKPDMASAEVTKALRQFGVRFDEEKHPAAAYDAKRHQITAIVPYGENSYLQALARLANRGQIKPLSQP